MSKALASGFLIAEILRGFAILCANWFKRVPTAQTKDSLLVLILLGATEGIICLLRYGRQPFRRLVTSKRIDLLLALLLGAALAAVLPAVSTSKYTKWTDSITSAQAIALLATPIILISIWLVSAFLEGRRNSTSPPAFFVSDNEKADTADDLLNVVEAAERFAERVLNGGSQESIVFGVDAPWGAGKSTFINFCMGTWGKHKDVIIYRFNPLQYEDRSHLLDKFVDGLVVTIKQAVFMPELRTIVSRYSKLITAQKNVSFAGFEFDLTGPRRTLDEAATTVRYALSKISHRVVVIVDDLDRMEFSSLKDMLFVIKKGFFLPNISFVLSYDTQNIAALENATFNDEKISEFLEKFVNVKVGLYLSSADLKRFISENLRIALGKNLQTDPMLLDEALGGLRELYDSENYLEYLPVIGDIRKIKRIINTLILLNVEKADFKNIDILPRDLILLLLVYLNYPHLFRQIYNTETNGRRGYFSLVREPDEGNRQYKNSTNFLDLVKVLEQTGRHTEKLLLTQLFDSGVRLSGPSGSQLSELDRHSFACFNSGTSEGRNLETYLNLIVRVAPPQKTDQYRFYVNAKDRLKGNEKLDGIFTMPEFSFDKGETPREQLWRVISNNLEQFDSQTIGSLIRHVLMNIPDYSALESPQLGLGMRMGSIVYTLLKLVDVGGWRDEHGSHRNNVDENIMEIAHWVLGLDRHASDGVLTTLASESRGLLGWHDALIFRLYCCVDRTSDLSNIVRSLLLQADVEIRTGTPARDLVVPQMRQASQLLFGDFKKQYILPGRNFLDEIDKLDMHQLAGRYSKHVGRALATGAISDFLLNDQMCAAKTIVKAFNTYQLTNKIISSGIGCGYYDPSDNGDGHGIHNEMNDYLFTTCFANSSSNDGFFHFITYLMIGFKASFDSGDGKFRKASPASEVLDQTKLKSYWSENAAAIKLRKFGALDDRVVTPNYSLTFKEGVPQIFDMLDNLKV